MLTAAREESLSLREPFLSDGSVIYLAPAQTKSFWPTTLLVLGGFWVTHGFVARPGSGYKAEDGSMQLHYASGLSVYGACI